MMSPDTIIAECKARPRRVVVPAGVPGPDGLARAYAIHDDAFDLLFEDVAVSFSKSRNIERLGWERFGPFVRKVRGDVEELWDDDDVQKLGFDLRWTMKDSETKKEVRERVECKFEEIERPNFFLEMLSNFKRGRWMKVGWVYYTQADVLLYGFLNTGALHILRMQPFLDWALGYDTVAGAGMDEGINFVVQRKSKQWNHSLGMLMPIVKVRDEAPKDVRLDSKVVPPPTPKGTRK